MYLRRIRTSQANKLQYFVGGTINESAFYADEVANFPWRMNTLTVDPTFKMQYVPHHRHQANIGVDFTLAGLFTYTLCALGGKPADYFVYQKKILFLYAI